MPGNEVSRQVTGITRSADVSMAIAAKFTGATWNMKVNCYMFGDFNDTY